MDNPTAREGVYRRRRETLQAHVAALCEHLWAGAKRDRPGPHLWSIPVNRRRDFDCALMDAFDELTARRELMAQAGIPCPEWDGLEEE